MNTRLAFLFSISMFGAGCARDFSWQEIDVANAAIGTTFRWRSSDELWVSGGTTILRRVSGSWEQLDACGPYAEAASFVGLRRQTVAFDGDDVWVLCGTGGDGVLVKITAGTSTLVDMPKDGALQLVDLLSGVALLGGTSMWSWTGSGWQQHPGPPAEASVAIGRSLNEIYHGTHWWNGSTWQPWQGPDATTTNIDCGIMGPPGTATLHCGPFTVSNGVGVTSPPFRAAEEIKQRGLAGFAMTNDGIGIFRGQAGGTAYFWKAALDDSELTYMGSGDFAASSEYAGGGIGGAFAIDEDTILLTWSAGAGISAGAAKYHLFEGHR